MPTRPGPTGTSPVSAWSRPRTWPPPSSWRTISTPRGPSSGRTSCTTCAATPPSTWATPTPPASPPPTTVEELRAENRTHRIVSVDEAVAMIKAGDAAAAPAPRRRPAARDRLALPPHRHRRRGHEGCDRCRSRRGIRCDKGCLRSHAVCRCSFTFGQAWGKGRAAGTEDVHATAAARSSTATPK